MKTSISIESIEAKQTGTGRPYWRAKANVGWCTIFLKSIKDKLEENIGKSILVELKETEKDGYNNKTIDKFYGLDVSNNAVVTEERVTQGAAQNKFQEQRQAKDVSIYTSYCKDMYLKLYEQLEHKPSNLANKYQLMDECITLVQYAKIAFEEQIEAEKKEEEVKNGN